MKIHLILILGGKFQKMAKLGAILIFLKMDGGINVRDYWKYQFEWTSEGKYF